MIPSQFEIKLAKHYWNMASTDIELPKDEWSFQSSDVGDSKFKRRNKNGQLKF